MSAKGIAIVETKNFALSLNVPMHVLSVGKVPLVHGLRITEPYANVRKDILVLHTPSVVPNVMEIVIVLREDLPVYMGRAKILAKDHAA